MLSGILRYRYLTSGVVMMSLLLLTHSILSLDYLLIGLVSTKTYDTVESIYKIFFSILIFLKFYFLLGFLFSNIFTDSPPSLPNPMFSTLPFL